TASEPMGMPNNLLITTPLSADRYRRRVREEHVVPLATRRRPDDRDELLDLRAVAAAGDSGLGGLLVAPEGHHEGLAFRRGQDVAALVADLILQLREHALLEQLHRAGDAHAHGVDLGQCDPGNHDFTSSSSSST